MPRYKIDWTENVYHRTEIEANNLETAYAIFHAGEEIDWFDESTVYGAELEPDFEIEETN